MSKKPRRHYTTEQKVALLKRHMVDKVPVATRAAVLGTDAAALVHIDLHGLYPEAVRLSDGLLDAEAVREHGVAPGSVFVRFCVTTAVAGSDDATSLAAAFVAAGAHAVVGSRWSVPDDTVRRFDAMFYAAKGASDPVAAVAIAQRKLVADRAVPVKDWSAFVVVSGLP